MATAEPPNPPPVIRAPTAPASFAAPTARSSSGQEISKSSRMEACDAANRSPSAGQSPLAMASTVCVTRAISVTTWRARRRMRSSASSATRSTVASRRESTPSRPTAVSQSARRLAYPPSTRACETPVSTTRSASPAPSSANGTARVGPSSKSISSAAPGSANIATVWSMPPVGAPATSVSARMHAATRRSLVARSSGMPATEATATATEHSRAADDDSPAPSGTVLSTQTSSPPTSTPDSRSAQTTPAT